MSAVRKWVGVLGVVCFLGLVAVVGTAEFLSDIEPRDQAGVEAGEVLHWSAGRRHSTSPLPSTVIRVRLASGLTVSVPVSHAPDVVPGDHLCLTRYVGRWTGRLSHRRAEPAEC